MLFAARTNNFEMVKLLMDAGAEVNVLDKVSCNAFQSLFLLISIVPSPFTALKHTPQLALINCRMVGQFYCLLLWETISIWPNCLWMLEPKLMFRTLWVFMMNELVLSCNTFSITIFYIFSFSCLSFHYSQTWTPLTLLICRMVCHHCCLRLIRAISKWCNCWWMSKQMLMWRRRWYSL